MLPIVLATVPIFLVIFLGAGLKTWRLLPEGFWAPAELLVYTVLLPALLISTLASAGLPASWLGSTEPRWWPRISSLR